LVTLDLGSVGPQYYPQLATTGFAPEFDYLSVAEDPQHGRVFAAQGSEISVFDSDTGHLLGTVDLPSRVT
jgi:hypothetical protein